MLPLQLEEGVKLGDGDQELHAAAVASLVVPSAQGEHTADPASLKVPDQHGNAFTERDVESQL